MRKISHFIFFFFLTISVPCLLHADSLTGVVRNVNYDTSKGFGLDVPPLVRVYVNAGTKYSGPGGEQGLRGIKDGDRVEVEGKTMQTGTFLATRVTKQGSVGGKVEDLASGTIQIKLNQSFVMGVSQKAQVTKDGKVMLTLNSKEFINTLCKGYDCGDVGEVGMRIEVKGGGESNEVLLISKNARKPAEMVKVELGGYEIQLIEAGEDVVVLVVRELS
jgi:hypothetical protein